MHKVLFVCIHNSARSQMAEAYLNTLGRGEFVAESAGFEPTSINPLVVEVMGEEGIDLSSKGTQSVFELFKTGRVFTHVVTVCDDTQESKCPIYPGMTHRLHLPFPDPGQLTGSHEARLEQTREIRDTIRGAVQEFIAWARNDTPLGETWTIKTP
jgi:arsenate reductase (thioredoxin)